VIRFLQTASWRSILGYAITLALIVFLAFLKIQFKDAGAIGFLLLLFELTVILPVIAAFTWCGKKSERRRHSVRKRIPAQPYM
jgi:heme/copper-type cytochrome/quinol oxidase subunit 4